MITQYINYHIKYNFLWRKNLNYLQELENLTKDELNKLKTKLSLNYIQVAYQKSKFYKKLYDENNINVNRFDSLDNFNDLPIIEKQDIIENTNDICTISKKFLLKGYTSGSTGTPLEVFRSYNSLLMENAYVWHYRQKNGLYIKDPIVVIRGDLGNQKLSYYDAVHNMLYLSSYQISYKNIEKYLALIKNFNPKAILAYPSSIFNLSIELDKINKKIYVPLIFTSSETLYAYQQDMIKKIFDAKIYDWYGNAERTIALEYNEANSTYVEPALYSHNIFKKDYVITTNLFNTAFPLINYKVDDTFEFLNNNIITNINGRNDDVITTVSGIKLGRMDVIFKGAKNILQSQIIQNKLEYFDVNIVIKPTFSEVDKIDLSKKILERVGQEIQFKINIIEEKDIVKMKSGKFKLVVSHV